MEKSIRIISLLMCVALCACLFSACGEQTVVSEQMVWVDGESGESGGSTAENTDSSGAGNTQSGTSQNQQGTQSDTGSSKKPAGANNKIDYSKYRGTTITFATWSDPYQHEEADAVKKFTKETGINVKVDVIPQKNYVQTLTSRVVSGKAPDVVHVNSTFPQILEVLEPIDAMQLDMNNSIWDKNYIDKFRVNGKAYFVNTLNSFQREGVVCYYNKKIFKQAGIKTPEQYYKEGKWTTDAMRTCLEELKELGGDIIPGMFYSSMYTTAMGLQNFTYQNGKFTTIYDDSAKLNEYKEISRFFLQLNKDGLLSIQSEDFNNGKAGIAIAEAWGLKTKGRFSKLPAADMGFLPLPSYKGKTPDQMTIPLGYGVGKGSKNAVQVGLFLTYFLDGNNYTTKCFKSAEAEKFYYGTVLNNKNVTVQWDYGVCAFNGKDTTEFDPQGDPASLSTFIDSKKNTVQSYAKKANDMLAKLK